MLPQTLEGLVDGLHAPALAQVGGVALVRRVRRVLAPAHWGERFLAAGGLGLGRGDGLNGRGV